MHKINLLVLGLLILVDAFSFAVAQPSQSTFLLLGEIHDNPYGHARRLQEINRLVVQGWRPVIAMEQFDLDQSADLALAQKICVDPNCVIRVAGASSRWDWTLYLPVIELAIKYKLKMVPANLSRSQAAIVVKKGISSALTPNTMTEFKLPLPQNSAVMDYQMEAVNKGHCGLVPTSLLLGLADAQIARDIEMAKSMLEENKTGSDVILLAGNGHVRNDFGVPYWLRMRALPDSIKTVGYLEYYEEGQFSPFDRVEQVPEFSRPDPCAQRMPSVQSIK